MNNKAKKQGAGVKKDVVLLGVILTIAVILLSVFPEKQGAVSASIWEFFIEMILILPAVMILMGLFRVFIPEDMVVKYLSNTAGIKAIFIGIKEFPSKAA